MVSPSPDNMVIDLTNDSDSEDQIQSQVGSFFFYILGEIFLDSLFLLAVEQPRVRPVQ